MLYIYIYIYNIYICISWHMCEAKQNFAVTRYKIHYILRGVRNI